MMLEYKNVLSLKSLLYIGRVSYETNSLIAHRSAGAASVCKHRDRIKTGRVRERDEKRFLYISLEMLRENAREIGAMGGRVEEK